jgi:hemerythrin-like domain-containing protein
MEKAASLEEMTMFKALSVIRDEHRSIGAILHGMQYLVGEIRERKVRIDPRVFSAMLYYLDTFSERMHHPKEDRFLFAPLRRLGPEAEPVIAQLEADHAEGGHALRRLEQYLVRYEEGGDREFPAFARAVDEFVQAYWEHMRIEEEQLFPLAEKLLTPDDWHVVDRAFAENRDPLAAERDMRDFQKLFSRIVNIAPPPIGVGPQSR